MIIRNGRSPRSARRVDDRRAALIALEGGQRLAGQRPAVPGDLSSAAFMAVAAAAIAGSDVSITNVGLNPSRAALLDVLRRFGAEVEATVEDRLERRAGRPPADSPRRDDAIS